MDVTRATHFEGARPGRNKLHPGNNEAEGACSIEQAIHRRFKFPKSYDPVPAIREAAIHLGAVEVSA